MEAAFALLLPLIAGYLYVSGSKRVKYKYSREEGHRLYFRIAFYGVCLFIASAVLAALLNWWVSHYCWYRSTQAFAIEMIRPILKEPDKASSQLAFFVICVLTMALGLLAAFVSNRVFVGKTRDALLEAAAENDLEQLLLVAHIEEKPISITLTSSKVYVGYVLHTPEPRSDRRVVALLPYMSGYRKKTGKVVFTTFYDEIYAERAKERDDEESNDFRLILPIDKFMSVSFFDVQTYAVFNAAASTSAPVHRRVKIHTDTGRRPRSQPAGSAGTPSESSGNDL